MSTDKTPARDQDASVPTEPGDWLAPEAFQRQDADTGRPFLQLTRGPSRSAHTYHHNTPFHPETKGLIIKSDRSGAFEYYQVEWGSWRFRQVSRAEGAELSLPVWEAGGRHVRFFEGNRLVEVDWETGRRRVLYEDDGGSVHGLSADLRSQVMYFVRILPDKHDELGRVTQLARQREGNRTYSGVKERVRLRPPCELVRMGWDDLRPETFARRDNLIAHPLAHPTDPDTACFALVAPHHLEGAPPKSWLVRRGAEPVPISHGTRTWTTCHQFFTASGDFVYDLTAAVFYRRPAFICVRRGPAYREVRLYAMPDRCCHYHVRESDGLFVGDGNWGGIEHSPFFPDAPPGEVSVESVAPHGAGTCLGDFVYGITLNEAEGVAWPKPWVRHGAHGQGQETHPHPTFSPDGRYVVYNSCLDGTPDVCLVEAD